MTCNATSKSITSSTTLFFVFILLISFVVTKVNPFSFSRPLQQQNTKQILKQHQYSKHINTIISKNTELYMSKDDDESYKSPSDAAIELVSNKLSSSLANLDSTFRKIRKRGGGDKTGSEWKRLNLNKEEESSSSEDEYVYMLPPPFTEKPSCVIIFIGGAVLGQFPHISYSELLQRLSIRMNAAILAIPYQVQLDHFSLAKQCATLTQRALWKCEEEYQWGLQPEQVQDGTTTTAAAGKIPIFALSHSLGAKLMFIILAANTKWAIEDVQSLGFMSFNNFGFVQSISMLRAMVDQIRGGGEDPSKIMDTIFDMTQQITAGLSIEFYPSPEAMEELIRQKVSEDVINNKKCRFFCFEDDELDCTQSIIPLSSSSTNTEDSISNLPGNHLTPVFWKLSLDDLPVDEVKEIASQFTNGFRSASFGDEDSLDLLVEEAYNWMIGREPTNSDASTSRRTKPRIASGSYDNKD